MAILLDKIHPDRGSRRIYQQKRWHGGSTFSRCLLGRGAHGHRIVTLDSLSLCGRRLEASSEISLAVRLAGLRQSLEPTSPPTFIRAADDEPDRLPLAPRLGAGSASPGPFGLSELSSPEPRRPQPLVRLR